LHEFLGQLQQARPHVKKKIIGDNGGILANVSIEMRKVADVLKRKGGFSNEKIKENIMGHAWAYMGSDANFEKVYTILWGSLLGDEADDEGEDDGDENEDDGDMGDNGPYRCYYADARCYKRPRYW